MQRDPRQLEPDRAGLYDVAASARLEGMLVRSDAVHVVAVPQRRVRLGAIELRGHAMWGETTPVDEPQTPCDELVAACRALLGPYVRTFPPTYAQWLRDVESPSLLADRIASALAGTAEQLAVLAEIDPARRLALIHEQLRANGPDESDVEHTLELSLDPSAEDPELILEDLAEYLDAAGWSVRGGKCRGETIHIVVASSDERELLRLGRDLSLTPFPHASEIERIVDGAGRVLFRDDAGD
jgi:hypothetical protein